MGDMVTVGGIRYRAEDAAREKLVADSKAHQKLIAEGKAPTGLSESAWKATQKDAPVRKAAGTKGSTEAPAPVSTGQNPDGSPITTPAS